jgi:histidinol phosphatase-like PHP family hydrolase
MRWQPLDCHAHTIWSDGALDVATLAEVVRGRGARPSVSDHLSSDVAGGVASVEEVRRYLDDLDRHDVRRGGEFCWHDSLWREIPDDVAARFTHRIGSLHAIHLPDGTRVHMFQRRLPAGLEPDAYMDAHVAELERFAREMPVEILAHPTLLPLPWRDRPLEEAGIAFEVSNRYRPHERFVRRAAARGVRLSLGSDGHSLEQVGVLDAPLAVARRAGVRDEELYDPGVHGSRTTRE